MTGEPLLLHRIDPARDMARFYRLAIEPNLFGGVSLVRAWGRIGGPGRTRLQPCDTADEAAAALAAIRRAKLRRGYVPLA